MKDELSEREGICKNCYLEFNIDDEGVQIVQHKNNKCLIIVDREAHSLLMGRDFKRALRDRNDQDHALSINKYLDDEDVPAEDSLLTALEDLKGANDIVVGEEAR